MINVRIHINKKKQKKLYLQQEGGVGGVVRRHFEQTVPGVLPNLRWTVCNIFRIGGGS
jgi:hypothetical protein